jgi:hypothetical protein
MSGLDPSTLAPAEKITGEDSQETASFREMLAEARDYILDQTWCLGIQEAYFGVGVGGVCAAWLFRLDVAPGADEWIWVVTGDLPSAYLVCDQVERPVDALRVYCDVMQSWTEAVREGHALEEEFPVDAPATEKFAGMLEKRLTLLREEIIPNLG